MQKEVKKKSLTFAVLAILLASTLSAVVYFGYSPNASTTFLKTFSSYSELNSFILSNTQSGYQASFKGPLDMQFSQIINPSGTNGLGGLSYGVPAPTSEDASALSGQSYSTTNIQVAGVDEADTVKTDGHYLYLLSQSKNSVYIIDANPQNAKILSTITFSNTSSLAGIYLSQDSTKIAVLGSSYTLHLMTYTNYIGAPYTTQYFQPEDVKTFVKVYDISNKNQPVIARDFSASGSYFNSRMIGDYVYAVVSEPVQLVNQTVTLPSVYKGTQSSAIPPTQIYYVGRDNNASSYLYNYYTFTSIFGINIKNDDQETSSLTTTMGGTTNIYASTNNMYLTYSDYTYSSPTANSRFGGYGEVSTGIVRVNLDGNTLTYAAQGNIQGNILNQYSMDEYQGYFRAATTIWTNNGQQNNVYVLNMDLAIVGKLENLASGENLHSARFMGDKCYLVTFRTLDPLFVIDLSVPSNPSVLGELKIPGYSDYLHPYDETHIIGVGKDTLESSSSEIAWFIGLKLSLFDVSNVNAPKQIATVTIGDKGTDSPVLTDPKAFLFDKSKDLLVIPVNLYLLDSSNNVQDPAHTYGTFTWQGVYVYNLTLNGGFQLKGNVTQLVVQTAPYNDQGSWITRSLYIDNTLYTISDQKVQLNSLEDMAFIAQIELTWPCTLALSIKGPLFFGSPN
jgi:inhibitor of cysteine peptidase